MNNGINLNTAQSVPSMPQPPSVPSMPQQSLLPTAPAPAAQQPSSQQAQVNQLLQTLCEQLLSSQNQQPRPQQQQHASLQQQRQPSAQPQPPQNGMCRTHRFLGELLLICEAHFIQWFFLIDSIRFHLVAAAAQPTEAQLLLLQLLSLQTSGNPLSAMRNTVSECKSGYALD